ncbi:MAG: helix-turn-helix transcriptional regulator [Minicystis sp.]
MDDAQTVAQVLEELGRRIRAARTARNLAQEKAAVTAGVDSKHWQELEAGRANATMQTLVRVASSLGMVVWDLLKTRAPTSMPTCGAASPAPRPVFSGQRDVVRESRSAIGAGRRTSAQNTFVP